MKRHQSENILIHTNDIRSVFTSVILLEFIIVLAVCFFSHGTCNKYFFFVNYYDEEINMGFREVGMDFFNSIYTLFSKNPYGESASNYPPLASLYFLMLYHFIPENISEGFPVNEAPCVLRGTDFDLRTYQQTMLLFILFIIAFVVLFLYMIEKYLGDYSRAKIFAVACCLTHGVLFGIERGNIILLALLFSFAFLSGYDSEKPVVRELSLISLGIAAGLKLYPALFGLLLIREKRWKSAIHTIIYGILAFLLPFFAFGGLQTVGTYLHCLIAFSESHNTLGSYGLSIPILAASHIISCISGASQDKISGIVNLVIKVGIALILVRGIFKSKFRWEQSLYITAAIVLFQPSDTYTLSFYLLPFLLLCKENPSLSGNMIEKVCMLVLLSIVPFIPVPPDHLKVTVSILAALAAQFLVIVECVFVSKRTKIC